jgi:hypothetical protein
MRQKTAYWGLCLLIDGHNPITNQVLLQVINFLI